MLCRRHLIIIFLTISHTLSALALFEGCDNVFNINAGTSYLESPYYPNYYPDSSSCRYKFIAPLDYYIEVTCTIDIYADNGKCTTDNFYVDIDGDQQLRGSENFCGQGTFSRTSAFRTVVLAYISRGNRGRFRCALNAKPKQSCDCGWSATTRIVNGQAANVNEYPGMVALKDVTNTAQRILCGGEIVAHRYILSAAHCMVVVAKPSDIVAIAGTNDLSNPKSSKFYAQYAIQQIIVHEQYQASPNTVNDIAVLVTAVNIEWSRGVGPFCLPPVGTTNDFSYNYVDVIGWGTTSFSGPTSSLLLKIQLMVLTNANCQTEYEGVETINAGEMCTYDYLNQNRDSCQYDSGGPVVLRQSRLFLVGIISFGKDCAGSSTVGVNTRITYYINWIRQKIGNTNCAVALS